MADRINFENKINDSAQVGDELFYGMVPTSVGTIIKIGDKYVEVNNAASISPTDFFSFKKINHSNSYAKSGAKGSYASVKMSIPNPQSKVKLFALGAEIAESSK